MSFDNFNFSDDDLKAAESAVANPYLADPAKGLGLVTRLIAHPPPAVARQQQQHLAQLHQLIHHDYINLASRDDYPAEAQAFRELLALEESLEDLVIFPDLANKTVIGVGGGFSAGKSRFLNTLLGTTLLPEALEPTTAIPTFITQGKQQAIVAVNTFNHPVEIEDPSLAAISHAFHKHYQKALGEEVGFAHVLKLLMVRQPGFIWENLAFLDTPGYSKAEEAAVAAFTDEGVALKQLTEADHVVWLVDSSNGSIRQDDLQFLKKLAPRRPVFLVITKADCKGSTGIQSIIDSTAKALKQEGIATAGIMGWAAPLGKDTGTRVAGDDFHAWLKTLNKQPKRTVKRVTCARIMDGFVHHNAAALKRNKEELAALNELLPMLNALPDNRRATFTAMRDHLRQSQKRLEEVVNGFSELRKRMLEAMTRIVGSVALDEEVKKGQAMSVSLERKNFEMAVETGSFHTARVISVKSDTKRVYLVVGDNIAAVGVSFSTIREGLGMEPLEIAPGTLLRCEIRGQDDRQIHVVISRQHA